MVENGLCSGHFVHLASTQSRRSFNRRIKAGNDFPALIAGKDQHSMDLEHANPMNKTDEHSDAGKQQRGHYPQATELNAARAAPVDPSQRGKGVKECGRKYPESVRDHWVESDPKNQSRRVDGGTKLNHHESHRKYNAGE